MATARLLASAESTLLTLVPTANRSRLIDALSFVRELYGERTLMPFCSSTFLEQALWSTSFLAEFCHDDDALIASLLQYALRVDPQSLSLIEKRYGKDVRDMVSRTHLLSHLYTAAWRRSAEDQRTMVVTVADDIRILLIALAVACTFLRHLHNVSDAYRTRLCRQCLHLFAPVAARLGIYALKYRLERSAFPECYPVDAQHISSQLSMLHQEHGAFLQKTSGAIRDFFEQQGMQVEVMAREKQPYSIFQKMRTRSMSSLEAIIDLFAIRVIVPEVEDCYQALGLLHRLGTPLSHRFKDYISFPKPNGYQSLHTCIMGLPHAPPDVMVEVQIRTRAMHQEAEYGIAAHWLYKEAGSHAPQRTMGDILSSSAAQVEGNDATAITLVDHIYVLTPHGDIVELPDGASPLDFAFHVHSDVGLRFKAARVNGSIVPLAHRLENGDVVDVATHKEPRPALQWIDRLVSSSAKAKLKAYFFSHNRPQFLARGRELLNAELKERKLPLLDADLTQLSTFDGIPLSTRERDDLLVKVGMGSVRTSTVLRHLSLAEIPRRRALKKRKEAVSPATASRSLPPVIIEGSPLTMPYRFAKCCTPDSKPTRAERLVGVVTRLGVITVHADTCRMIRSVHPDRKVSMRWREER